MKMRTQGNIRSVMGPCAHVVNQDHSTLFAIDPIPNTKNDLYISKVTFLEQPEEQCVPLLLTIFPSYTAFREHNL